ncbi:CsbD family protein [Pseudorhodoferax sp. Leaf267]|uniref:CsbD family protein n=1 Tax=Pseudorhodoferax sp. Leaf267 TaxID=1736316 RepID=UPI0006F8CBF2|nr:CsbD family protein [Pseudorhodoferax sp. Leaf267]KQP18207.1 general stress protein CsbD [Pseudorhodoferax sp. Leaf267]
MNEDKVAGNWKQFKGKVQEQWGKLTNDDLDIIEGRREQLLGRIQERHGIARDAAEREVDEWHSRNPDFFFEKSQ